MCVVLSCGARFTTQGIAWVNMLVTAIPSEGLSAGLQQTFDGEHPCALCKQIQQSEERDEREATHEERRIEFIACLQDRPDHNANSGSASLDWQPSSWALGCFDAPIEIPPPIRL